MRGLIRLFRSAVEATKRRKLVIAGVTADVCLTFPAIGAAGNGYDVYAVMDAWGTVNSHAMFAAMFRLSQAGVKVANTHMVLAELLADPSSAPASEIGALYSLRLPNFGFIAAQRAAHAPAYEDART